MTRFGGSFFAYQPQNPADIRFVENSQKIKSAAQKKRITKENPYWILKVTDNPDSPECSSQTEQGKMQWDFLAGDVQQSPDAEGEIDQMGDEKTEKIPHHPVFWEKNI